MFIDDPGTALELGLFIRALMYALLFFGMGVAVWQAQHSMFGPRTNAKLIKALAILCLLVAGINIFMAFEWLVIYFV